MDGVILSGPALEGVLATGLPGSLSGLIAISDGPKTDTRAFRNFYSNVIH